MANETQGPAIWNSLSQSFSKAVEAVEESIVTVHGGGRTAVSGVVWRPGIIVTVHHGLRRNSELSVARGGEPSKANLAGTDGGTDLAVLRLESDNLKPAQTAGTGNTRVGEVVLSVGRSGAGDISASAGIIARLGGAWRSWRGGQIDRLIRPDLRLYVGLSGSALVDERHRVLGISSLALARHAVITIPAETVDRVVDVILEKGHVPRPFLGLAMQAVPLPETMRPQLAEGTDQVLLVLHVEPLGPAAAAGVLVGDLIVSLNGSSVSTVHEILDRLAALRVGDPASLVVIRGGVRMDLTLNVADRG